MPRNRAIISFVLIVVVTGLLEGTVRVLSWALPELIPFEYTTPKGQGDIRLGGRGTA
mgnify:CR=1 FL=1|jgi:hypothetical protein